MSDNGAASILIVDDEEDIRAVLSARLEAAGFHVGTVGNGMEALNRIRSETPNLIILDVMLPGVDGFGVCAMVKRDQRFNRIPIIILTARTQAQDRHTSFALGADAYMTKPFRADELLGKIRELLDGHGNGSSPKPQPEGADERVPASEAAS